MKKEYWVGILLVLMVAFPATGIAAPAAVGVTDEEVVVGITVPMSGPAALWASMGLSNAAWAQHINDQGGIHGRKIRVVLKDDGYNPARALANLSEMKSEVFAYGCIIGSAAAHASKDLLIESQIPVVHVHANPRMWVEVPPEKMRHIFIAYPDYVDEAEAITQFAVGQVNIQKIALFGQNDDWGKSAKIGIEKALKGSAGKAQFVGFVPYELTERTLASHAMKVQETGADGLIIYAAPTQAAIMLKEMAKIGYNPKIFTANPLGDPLMYKIAGELWEGAYPAASGNVAMPDVEEQADKVVSILLQYQPKLAGTKFLGVTGATTMMLIAEGLNRAGRDLTRENFVSAMESITDFRPQNMGGPITFGPKRHHGLNSIRMCHAEGGKHIPVTDYMVFEPLF